MPHNIKIINSTFIEVEGYLININNICAITHWDGATSIITVADADPNANGLRVSTPVSAIRDVLARMS